MVLFDLAVRVWEEIAVGSGVHDVSHDFAERRSVVEVVAGEDDSGEGVDAEGPGGKSFGDEDGLAVLGWGMNEHPLRGCVNGDW